MMSRISRVVSGLAFQNARWKQAISSGFLRPLFSGMAVAMGLRVLGLALAAASLALISRKLPLADCGEYLLSLSLVTLGNCAAGLGLPVVVIRHLAGVNRTSEERGTTIISAMLLTTLSGLLVGGMCSGISWWYAHSHGGKWEAVHAVCLITWVLLSTLNICLGEMYRGLHRIGLAGFFGGVLPPLMLCSMILLGQTWSEMTLRTVLLMTVASYTGSLIVGGFTFASLASAWNLKFSSQMSSSLAMGQTLLREAFPVLVAMLCMVVLGQVDLWVVGAMCPLEETAIYGAAARLMALMSLPLAAVNLTIPPKIAALHHQTKHAELQRLLRVTATLAASAAFVFMVVVLVGAELIFSVLFGPEFVRGSTVLRILAVSQFLVISCGSPGYTLMMTGHRWTPMVINLGAVVYVVAGSLWLTPSYGLWGAAMASASGLVLQKLVLVIMTWRAVQLWCPAYLWVPSRKTPILSSPKHDEPESRSIPEISPTLHLRSGAA